MLLKNIFFKQDVIFDSNRESHKKMFKVKKRTYTYVDQRNSIYNEEHEFVGYEKKKVTKRTFIIFKKDLEIEFKDNLTIIVGDNGCGKTSLIKNLIFPYKELNHWFSEDKEKHNQEVVQKYIEDKVRKLTFSKFPQYIIIEKEIHKTSFLDTISKNIQEKAFQKKSIMNDTLLMFNMQEASNDENSLDFFESLTNIENSLIVLDEPETSLSIKSQLKVSKLIKELSTKNQIVLITHSEYLMRMSNKVYDFEQKKYLDTEQYIKSQKQK